MGSADGADILPPAPCPTLAQLAVDVPVRKPGMFRWKRLCASGDVPETHRRRSHLVNLDTTEQALYQFPPRRHLPFPDRQCLPASLPPPIGRLSRSAAK